MTDDSSTAGYLGLAATGIHPARGDLVWSALPDAPVVLPRSRRGALASIALFVLGVSRRTPRQDADPASPALTSRNAQVRTEAEPRHGDRRRLAA